MGLVQSDVSLGREVELYNRVNNSDPTNAVLTAVVLASPAEATSALRGYATLATLLAANPEVTNTNYARIELDDADLAAAAVDSATHTYTLELPVLTWDAGGGPDAGDAWDYVVICYDSDSTGGADSAIIPISYHELRKDGVAVVPNGSPIVVDLSDGFVRASSYP
jgi:hypothetical protein